MDILNAVILGIVEGLTEFLPISSTGHLIVVSNWLGIEQTDNHKAFEVIIQLAAILAVITHYRDKFTLRHIPLWTNVALSFIPIAVVGFLLHEQIKMLFTVQFVALMFIAGGMWFLFAEASYRTILTRFSKTTNIEDVSSFQAVFIGIFQLAALLPGMSRAGASILGGIFVHLDRRTAAEWSFLLALPVLAAAAGFDMLKHAGDFTNENLVTLAVGFLVSYVIAWASIEVFLVFLQMFTYTFFGVYRIIFGVLLLTVMAK